MSPSNRKILEANITLPLQLDNTPEKKQKTSKAMRERLKI